MYSKLIYEGLLNTQLNALTALFKQHTKLHSSNKIIYKSVYLNINHKNTKYKIHAILSHDNPRKKKWLPMQALPHTGHVTPVYIIYTKAGTHLPTQIFTNCVPNTKHNKIQHSSNTLPVIWYSSPKPHTTAHTPLTRMDGQTRSPHDALYCTSQTMLINHEYGLTSNGIRHRAYRMSSKSSSSYGHETCRGRTDSQIDLTIPPYLIPAYFVNNT